jgi:hypothetical protein
MDKRNKFQGVTIALSEGAAKQKKFGDIYTGRNIVYVEFSADEATGREDFVCLGFEHHGPDEAQSSGPISRTKRKRFSHPRTPHSQPEQERRAERDTFRR